MITNFSKEEERIFKQGQLSELERHHEETLKIVYDVLTKPHVNNTSILVNALVKAYKERLKELK